MKAADVIRAGAAWWAVLVFPAVLGLPFILRGFVHALRFVLEALNNFGAG